MRAWRLRDSFGIDRLELEERPDPALGHGEVRVRVRAVSLNYRDVLMVEHGVAPRGVQLPLLPCSDAAGEVVEVGSGVSRVQVGDRVASIVFQSWLDGDTLPPAAYGSVLAGGLDGVLADNVVLHEDGLAGSGGCFVDAANRADSCGRAAVSPPVNRYRPARAARPPASPRS